MLAKQRLFLSVVVTCTPAQYKYLPDAIAAVQRQTRPFDLKILVFDLSSHSEAPSIQLPVGWQMITGAWHNLNEARNAGLRRALNQSDWITFWDATHRAPVDYNANLERVLKHAEPNVGVVYPNVNMLSPGGKLIEEELVPEWSTANSQEFVLCSAASFWRKLAVNEIGGFNVAQVGYENYEITLRMARCGWKGLHSHQSVSMIRDAKARTEVNPGTSLWNAWSYAFVTLWSGNLRTEFPLLDWYTNADIPPNSTLYWVDNSQGRLKGFLTAEYASRLAHKFQNIVYMDAGPSFQIDPKDTYFNYQRHTHVAHLYNHVLSRIKEEIVVTIEDDMVPPKDGLRTLVEHLRPNTKVSMATGVYRSRTNPEHVCAATGRGMWLGVHKYDSLPDGPFEIGMSGGGFALFANWALQHVLPVRCIRRENGYMLGWDGNLGNSLTEAGYRLIADPNVKCQHLCHEVLDFLRECKDDKPTSYPYCGDDPYKACS